MGVQHVRLHAARHFQQARLGGLHERVLGQAGQPGAGGRGRAEEVPPVHGFFRAAGGAVLGAGEVEGVPAQPALLAQQGQRAEGVAAVQGDGVVQDVEDAHGGVGPGFRPASHCQ